VPRGTLGRNREADRGTPDHPWAKGISRWETESATRKPTKRAKERGFKAGEEKLVIGLYSRDLLGRGYSSDKDFLVGQSVCS